VIEQGLIKQSLTPFRGELLETIIRILFVPLIPPPILFLWPAASVSPEEESRFAQATSYRKALMKQRRLRKRALCPKGAIRIL